VDRELRLPKEVEAMIWQEVSEYEAETHKPYIKSVERIGFERGVEQGRQQGIQEGIQQGLQQGIQQGRQQGIQEGLQQGIRQGLLAGIKLGLKLKFGSESVRLLPEIYKIKDVDVLQAIYDGIEMVDTLEELRHIYT